MKPKRTLRHLLAAIGCATIAISSASAQTDGTWTQSDSGTYDWSDATNWLDDIVAGGTDATASFTVNSSGSQTANLDTAVTIGNLTLDRNNNLTIDGTNALTLDASSGIPTLDVNSGRTVDFRTELAGTDGLLLQGGGRLDINAAPTLEGGLTVIGSTVRFNPSGGFNTGIRDSALANGPLSLSEGGSVLLRGDNDTNSQVSIGTGGGLIENRGNNDYETTGILTGSGTLTYGNAGGAGGRTLQFNSTDNDFTGGFVLTRSDQTIQVNSLGGGNNITFNSAGTFRYGFGAEADVTLGAIDLNGSGGTIRNDSSDHAITISSDLIASGGGAKTLELSAASGDATNIFAGDIDDGTGGGTVALEVSGGGAWELQGANTFTGNTTVSAGTLTLADVSSMRFEIGDSGDNNEILGNGTVRLDGTFVFDLTDASTTINDFWNVVDVDNLNESYGTTFSVVSTQGSFSETNGVWSISENDRTYEFSQDTGILTVIPEPSIALLGGIGMLCLLRRRR